MLQGAHGAHADLHSMICLAPEASLPIRLPSCLPTSPLARIGWPAETPQEAGEALSLGRALRRITEPSGRGSRSDLRFVKIGQVKNHPGGVQNDLAHRDPPSHPDGALRGDPRTIRTGSVLARDPEVSQERASHEPSGRGPE